ncbi:hypothetical protein BT69DRAFT_1279400 [Atractiella rhizophila]|nr:hypothetical protein BT69DRAFT_1279400 [Atractiella rhizophila]
MGRGVGSPPASRLKSPGKEKGGRDLAPRPASSPAPAPTPTTSTEQRGFFPSLSRSRSISSPRSPSTPSNPISARRLSTRPSTAPAPREVRFDDFRDGRDAVRLDDDKESL